MHLQRVTLYWATSNQSSADKNMQIKPLLSSQPYQVAMATFWPSQRDGENSLIVVSFIKCSAPKCLIHKVGCIGDWIDRFFLVTDFLLHLFAKSQQFCSFKSDICCQLKYAINFIILYKNHLSKGLCHLLLWLSCLLL